MVSGRRVMVRSHGMAIENVTSEPTGHSRALIAERCGAIPNAWHIKWLADNVRMKEGMDLSQGKRAADDQGAQFEIESIQIYMSARRSHAKAHNEKQ
jgi:hypothetical protein